MAKLRFKIQGVEFEYVGDDYEIERFIHRLLTRGLPMSPTQTLLPESKSIPTTTQPVYIPSPDEQIDLETPPDSEIADYIMSKQNYAHEIFEVQDHYFGKTFPSRGNTRRIYQRTAEQLRRVRRKIAETQNGTWKSILGAGRRKRWKFIRATEG